MTRERRLVVLLAVHVGVITAITAYLAWSLRVPAIGANIGAGLSMLALAVIGLPWSLLAYSGALPVRSSYAVGTLLIWLALSNLLLHAGAMLWRTRRARSDGVTGMPNTDATTTGGRRAAYTLTVHVAALTGLAGLQALTLNTPTIGANFGAILTQLFMATMGIPWSILGYLAGPNVLNYASAALFITFALCNVLIHAAIALWWTRPDLSCGRRS